MTQTINLSAADHERVTAAVSAAERATDAEISTIVAERSDAYHDVALHWTTLLLFLVAAVVAAWPDLLIRLHSAIDGGWRTEYSHAELLTLLLFLLAIKFLIARLILGWMPLRMALTPAKTKARRVRSRAILLFRVGTEKRTASRTGVLLYLSLAEHRAEIVADQAIHARVGPEAWGDAMAALIGEVREGRTADGMCAAVAAIGAVLAQHFPHSGTDANELPDRLIEL